MNRNNASWPRDATLPISPECLGRIRALTLSKREFGFQFVPKINANGECVIECLTTLIQGTEMSADDPDVKLYNEAVEVASTPFYAEVFSVSNVCNAPAKVNMFAHTHQIGHPAPPSLGDFAAHGFLANLRQRQEGNGVLLNSQYVVAFEGIYEYNITEPKFNELLGVLRKIEQKYPKEVAEERSRGSKELAENVVDDIKMHITNELGKYNSMYYNEVEELCRGKEFSVKGARMMDDKLWKCKAKECQPTYSFEFAKRLASCAVTQNKLIQFHKTNSYARGLRDHGFYYNYIPYDMTNGIQLPIKVSD
jgi:hypothetical protein